MTEATRYSSMMRRMTHGDRVVDSMSVLVLTACHALARTPRLRQRADRAGGPDQQLAQLAAHICETRFCETRCAPPTQMACAT